MEINNLHDIIDSRDVIARIEELEGEREAYIDDFEAITEEQREVVGTRWDDCEEEGDELAALVALAEEGSGSADWNYGETLIHEDYFEEYAQQLAEDLGLLGRDLDWPASCIDWKEAAEQLAIDYSLIDFDGQSYYIR